MSLSLYNKNILNFLYELTKLKKFMSYDGIAKQIKIEGKEKISPKTVERWFSFLRQKYNFPGSKTKEKFNFYPTFFFEKLGLALLFVISEKPNTNILNNLPFQNYIAWLFNPEINESVLLTGYLVPIQYISRFKKEWEKIRQKGLVKDYKIYLTNKGFTIYSPWHKVIDKEGIFHPENNINEEIERQIKELERYLDNLPKIEMIPIVKKNPLIIPVLFEYYYQYWTSPKVWEAIKKRFSNRIWNYIQKKNKQNDNIGIKKVQQTIKQVYDSDLIQQMRVVYMPIELKNNFFIYFIIEDDSSDRIIKSIGDIALNSIYISIYPISDKKFFVISLTNQKIIEILHKHNIKRLYFLQHEKSLPLLTAQKYKKYNYANYFDLIKGWIWN